MFEKSLSYLDGKAVVFAPYNDLSETLVNELNEKVKFCGFYDSCKKGTYILEKELIGEDNVIVISSPNYWQEIAQLFPKNEVLIYNRQGYELIEFNNYLNHISKPESVDVLLLPYNKSNIIDLSLVAKSLEKIGISSALIDVNSDFDKNIAEGFHLTKGVKVIHQDCLPNTGFHAVVASNDWDPGFGRNFILKQRELGKLTIGIVDGIEDFKDADYGYERHAYQTTEFVMLMGYDDLAHFSNKKEKTTIIGLPKMWSLYKNRSPLPPKNKLMVNVNFTYGSFENEREAWVSKVLVACEQTQQEFIISQHHADNGRFPPEIVSAKNVYETINDTSIVISRFSTVVLEALAMGRKVIYFNPHGETVDLYKSPNGAFEIAHSLNELVACIHYYLGAERNEKAVETFLNNKCHIKSDVEPSAKAALYIQQLLQNRDTSNEQ